MAQGAVKKTKSEPKRYASSNYSDTTALTVYRQKPAAIQRGARVIKPKKPALVKQNQMKKVCHIRST